MKKFLWFVVILSTSTALKAEEDQELVYQQFVEIFVTANSAALSDWLMEDYEISFTFHLPNRNAKVNTANRQGLLKQINKTGNIDLGSLVGQYRVQIISEREFCGTSDHVKASATTYISGKKYRLKNIQKVCFVKQLGEYKAIKHSVDIEYMAL